MATGPQVFVLGGVVHAGPPRDLGFVTLRAALRLQPGVKEMKFEHVAKGDFLTVLGSHDPALDRDQALEEFGLAKFPQPLLVAGPITINGVGASGLAYLGLPPEAVTDLALEGRVRSLLTIENLESFHRHVRECRTEGDLVVYCGGFPAQAVIRALRWLADHAAIEHFHHWGDVDAGGVRIGRFLEESLSVPIVPHLMSEALAIASGRAVPPVKDLAGIPQGSAFSVLARFLASERAHFLEQEVLDPLPLCPSRQHS